LNIGLAAFDMATRICFGIPKRIGVCFCELGKERDNEDVIEPTETTTDFSEITATVRESGNAVIGLSYTDVVAGDGANDGAQSLAAVINCWTDYPPSPEFSGDPAIVRKARGDIAEGEANAFPSIKITARPLKTVLNYSYAGNFNSSGQGEVGYESANTGNDTLAVNYWEGSTAIPVGEEGQGIAWQANQDVFAGYVAEQAAPMLSLSETHYFKSSDRPSEEPTPWQPLSGLEVDPTLSPRLPSMPAYDLGRNETVDFRYRYPANYLTKFGSLYMPEGYVVTLPEVILYGATQFDEIPQGAWQWTTYAQADPNFTPPLNPLFEPTESDIFLTVDSVPEGVAPIVKGWYWDSSTPPTNGLKGLVQSTNFKMIKEIRKRYPFSFRTVENKLFEYRVTDHTPGNQMVYNVEIPDQGSYLQRSPAFYTGNINRDIVFNAKAHWRFEIEAELAEWNSKRIEGTDPLTGLPNVVTLGATIKGTVRLGLKRLVPGNANEGIYSLIYTQVGFSSLWDNFNGVTPSYVYRCEAETYFDENFIQRFYVVEWDAGTIPWQVTLDKDNAKGSPISFLDLPIDAQVELPGQSAGEPGTIPDNCILYVKDIIVTEVILP
jgi:hypothetical protein